MRKYLFLICTVLAAACASPKYTYYFDHYDYNSGRKSRVEHPSLQLALPAGETSPLLIGEGDLMASAGETPVALKENDGPATATEAKSIFAKKYRSMTKVERKEFRRELKKEMKNYMKAKKSGDHVAAANATGQLDNDLKLAIIFGAVGLTLTLFGGVSEAFWVLGVIAIVVGLVFFIKWIMRQ